MGRVFRAKLAVFALCFAAAGAACTPSVTSPSEQAEFSKVDLTVGTGATAANGNTLNVLYTGWLYDANAIDHKGPQFDTSGTTTFPFVLGGAGVISGWNQGMVGMQVGGVRRLIIPPSLGYGATRHGIIPPDATLVFDVTLSSIGS